MIVDSKGKPIQKGSIVSFVGDDNYQWKEHQGLVLDPDSGVVGEGYTVAVFFGPEVDPSMFNIRRDLVERWSEKHTNEMRKDNFDFILQDDNWKDCSRVVWFLPKDIVVLDRWSVLVRAKRLFGDRFIRYCPFNNPEDYNCCIIGCTAKANKVALFNHWGTVYSYPVCDSCFESQKLNGWSGDGTGDIIKSRAEWTHNPVSGTA